MNEKTAGGGLRRWGGAAALVAGGLLAGVVVAGTITATADPTTSTAPDASTSSQEDSQVRPPAGGEPRDESKSQRPDEQLLTGDNAEKVKAAALEKYPGATVLRVETDSDGVYEAHLTTADGARVTVEVGEDFAVTGEEAGGPRK